MNIEEEVSNDEKISLIMRQTNYSYEEARQKLLDCNNDPILTIKKYFGISDKERKTTNSSLNQEIYKQIREKMNNSIYEYNKKVNNEKVVLH
jgi:hypothetical protein